MTKGKTSKAVPDVSCGGTDYTLWTAPSHSWNSPLETGVSIEELHAKVRELDIEPARDDEETAAFTTPVTADVLSRPTKS